MVPLLALGAKKRRRGRHAGEKKGKLRLGRGEATRRGKEGRGGFYGQGYEGNRGRCRRERGYKARNVRGMRGSGNRNRIDVKVQKRC